MNTIKKQDMSENSKVYPHVIGEISDWPIAKLLSDRRNFVQEIDDFTFNRLKEEYGDEIIDVILKTIYLERIRIKQDPWKVDPPNEQLFWKKIKNKLMKRSHEISKEEMSDIADAALRTIIHRYSEEIVGTFRKPTFLFARKFLTMFFNRLLNTAAGRNMKRIFGSKYKVYERLLTRGEIEKIRTLINKGTVIIVPTHSSNLDSILIGYAMDAILGLPSFSYGAGLNLYNTGYTAYYMNRLGAYRIDRRKKNPIYLTALKAMSNLSVQRGTNSLFFPGGTRSRSGELETKLKMGMTGTIMEAQRANFEKGKNEKIFIVPLILSYHVVLEAKFLIEQHLRRIGKEHYFRGKDEFHSFRKLMKFGWNFFSQPSEITLSFGKPMDVLGNFVDDDGNSFDRFGKPLDVKEYFMKDGMVTKDLQRESEYTKILSERIVERYFKENIVLTSHLIAFAAFCILLHENPRLDLFGVLRLPNEDYVFPKKTIQEVIRQLRDKLLEMSELGKIKLSKQIHLSIDELITNGVRNLGVYHVQKPLVFNKKGQLISQDFRLLFFYHNRLKHYKLENSIDWKKVEGMDEFELVEEMAV